MTFMDNEQEIDKAIIDKWHACGEPDEFWVENPNAATGKSVLRCKSDGCPVWDSAYGRVEGPLFDQSAKWKGPKNPSAIAEFVANFLGWQKRSKKSLKTLERHPVESFVYLESGVRCEVLATRGRMLWVEACDGSWGPGTVDKYKVYSEKHPPMKLQAHRRVINGMTRIREFLGHQLNLEYGNIDTEDFENIANERFAGFVQDVSPDDLMQMSFLIYEYGLSIMSNSAPSVGRVSWFWVSRNSWSFSSSNSSKKLGFIEKSDQIGDQTL
jgi:hypothetical protein